MQISLSLTLICLIKVYNYQAVAELTGGNVALRGLALQSSSVPGQGEAHLSIDGNMDTDYFRGSCSLTNYELQPWWSVDLGRGYLISSVAITNVGISMITEMQGAEIHVGESMDGYGVYNPSCATITFMALGETKSFDCGAMPGRYVTVVIPNRVDVLAMCEVQVTAIQIPDRQLGIMIHSLSDSGGDIVQEPQNKELIIQQVRSKMKENIATLRRGQDNVLERDTRTCVPLKILAAQTN
ncbi:fucolectin-like [Ascaphus truei]|uniref:fucolectin-like n=1 Tax=Ascaphus truei TaxID=8439 RepID=UPI003F5A339D